MRLASFLTLCTLVALGGCSIKQHVTPAEMSVELEPEVCMIPAPNLRPGFTTVYQRELVKLGFRTRLMTPGSNPGRCTLATSYTGNWGWDLALYMKYADIRVYEQGRQVGYAQYDARWGGGRLDKFISAENKIAELTRQLFPNGAAHLGQASPRAMANETSSNTADHRRQQLEQLKAENLSYEEYQRRYRELTAE